MVLTLYRFSRVLSRLRIPLLPRLIYGINRVVFGVVLPPSAELGKDVVISYQGLGVVIHARAVIGDNVVIFPGVLIGGRSGAFEVPVIENGVEIGAGAKILGPIRIGAGARIGANAVVLTDIPSGVVAVGIPARIVKKAAGEHAVADSREY